MKNKQNNKIPFLLLFLLMVFVSLSLDSKIRIPFGTLLRWAAPAMLLFWVFLSNNKKFFFPGNILYWLLIAIFAAAALISPQSIYSFQRWLSFLLITLTFLNYFAFAQKHDSLYDAAAAFGWLYAAYSILNLLFLQWGADRPTGLTLNANSLGHFSNLSFLFFLLYFKKSENKKTQRWILTAMAVCVVLVIISASRTALIILMINIMVAVWLIGTQKSKVLICAAMPLVIIVLLLNAEILENIPGFKRIIENEGVGDSRQVIWDHGIYLIRQKPWLGWGYGISISLNIVESLSFHNSYLTVAIECGLLGLISLVLLILFIMAKGIFSWIRSKRIELLIFLMLALNKIISFIGESSMTSVGSAEGFFFWGVMMWLLVEFSCQTPSVPERI